MTADTASEPSGVISGISPTGSTAWASKSLLAFTNMMPRMSSASVPKGSSLGPWAEAAPGTSSSDSTDKLTSRFTLHLPTR